MPDKTHVRVVFLSLFMFALFMSANGVYAHQPLSAGTQNLKNGSINPLSPTMLTQQTSACSPTVSGNKPGLNGTVHSMAFDGSVSSFFESSHDNWQYITIDFKCVGTFSALRRYMTTDGDTTSGTRFYQGEGVSYSVDGRTWTNLIGSTTSGWQGYVNYRPHAWHSVNYGWSDWLKLNAPVQARYVRFNWDGDYDALNEIQVDFVPGPQINALFCDAGGGRFLCTTIYSGASGPVTASWRISSGQAQITSTLTNNTVSTAQGTCRIGGIFTIEVTVTDASGNSDTARRSGVKCYAFLP